MPLALYLKNLNQQSQANLLQDYLLQEVVQFKDFQLINSYLIHQAIDNNLNVLLTLPDKDDKDDFYVPVIFITALLAFLKNYTEYRDNIKIGDIIYAKNGDKYRFGEVIAKSNNLVKYGCKEVWGEQTTVISDVFIVDQNIQDGKKYLPVYKKVFDKIFKINNNLIPSKFKYKTAIVTDKYVFDKLKEHKITFNQKEKTLYNAFPFQYITKNGKTTNNLPIEPMMYITNDYTALRDHVLDKDIILDSVIIIGAAKYRNDLTNISRDLNRSKFENIIFIGNEDITDFSELLKWNWTRPEITYFSGNNHNSVNKIIVDNSDLMQTTKEYLNYLQEIESMYSINLSQLNRFIPRVWSLINSNLINSRLNNQIRELQACFEYKSKEVLQEKFDSIGEGYTDTYLQLNVLFENILKATKKIKIETLKKNIAEFDYIVVPKELKQVWEEEKKLQRWKKINIITQKDFVEKESDMRKSSRICFLSLYGYECKAAELVEIINNSRYRVSIFMYEDEQGAYNYYLNKYREGVRAEYKSKDRKKLSGIEYVEIIEPENVSDLIKRMMEADDKNSTDRKVDEKEELLINYRVIFTDNFSVNMESTKSVLRESGGEKINAKVSSLIQGDKIRVYESTTKEILYKVALDNDTEGVFAEIEEASQVWKDALKRYFQAKQQENSTYDYERLFAELKDNGSKLQNSSQLKKWLNKDYRGKFPKSVGALIIIKKTVSDGILDGNFDEIKKARNVYNRIMIALGRDMSDEVMDYIISGCKNKGKILSKLSDEQIKNMAEASAPLKEIRSIEVIQDDNAE